MPDPRIILPAMAAAAVVAVVLVLASGRSRAPQLTRAALGWVLGISAGFYLGTHLLGLLPEWGLSEVRHRMLFVVVPAAIAVELIAAFAQAPRWIAWPLRGLVAAGAGYVLLYGSVDLARWTAEEKAIWLGSLAGVLFLVWVLLGLLMHVAPSRGMPLALSVVCAGAALTIMLSGSATDGQLGLVLGAAVGGAALASFLLPAPPQGTAAIGIGVVALFSLLVGGRFFADLTTVHAAVLCASALLCWLPQLPPLRKLKPWLRDGLCVLAVAIPVAIVVFQAERAHTAQSKAPGSDDDWGDFYRDMK